MVQDSELPAGERPAGESANALPEVERCLRLASGKLFPDRSHSSTSGDGGVSWHQGGGLLATKSGQPASALWSAQLANCGASLGRAG